MLTPICPVNGLTQRAQAKAEYANLPSHALKKVERTQESSYQLSCHGHRSACSRCMAAWMSRCDSESLTQTIRKRDFVPLCSTQMMSPERTLWLMPESRAPLLLTLVATTCSVKHCPVLSLSRSLPQGAHLLEAHCAGPCGLAAGLPRLSLPANYAETTQEVGLTSAVVSDGHSGVS
jgi:hypothetical protein